MATVNLRHALGVAATLHGTRATSLRRWLAWLAPHPESSAGRDALATLAERWLAEPPPRDDRSALRRLVAEDLRALLPGWHRGEEQLSAWSEPRAALAAACRVMCAELSACGIDCPPPAVGLIDRFPDIYAHPSLWVVSIDQADAQATGLAPGLWFRSDRLQPLWSELALGHAIIHGELGRRSPERLGRGFEEGLAEVLGGLHAASAAIGAQAVEATFAALRLTASAPAPREAMLGAARAAALLHRRHGLAGLAALVAGGRERVKQAEAALGRGTPERVDLEPGRPDPPLAARLERLLEARGRPLPVGPLAFWLARWLRAGDSVAAVAAEQGIPADTALAAARELHERAFVAVLDGSGRVLVDDLELALGAAELRYEMPPNCSCG